MTKTCGECKHCENKKTIATCQYVGIVSCDDNWCRNYEQKAVSNGDKIIAGGTSAIAEFQQQCSCDNCVYFDNGNPFHPWCDRPHDKTCTDGIEAWLNAPAESEGEDDPGRD